MRQRPIPCPLLPTLTILVSFSCLSGCIRTNDWHNYDHILRRCAELNLSEKENALRVNEIADRVQRAYSTINYLSFRTEPNWEGRVHGNIETHMAAGRLKTRLRLDGKVVFVVTCRDNTVEEMKFECKGEPQQREVRPADATGGTHDLSQLGGLEEYGCMLGGCIASWVGSDTAKPKFFEKRIREGFFLGQTSLRGDSCDLVIAPANARYGGIELMYVRPDGFVIQNDSFFKGKGDSQPRLRRQRPFLEISTSPLPHSTWDFERPVKSMDVLTPAAVPKEKEAST